MKEIYIDKATGKDVTALVVHELSHIVTGQIVKWWIADLDEFDSKFQWPEYNKLKPCPKFECKPRSKRYKKPSKRLTKKKLKSGKWLVADELVVDYRLKKHAVKYGNVLDPITFFWSFPDEIV